MSWKKLLVFLENQSIVHVLIAANLLSPSQIIQYRNSRTFYDKQIIVKWLLRCLSLSTYPACPGSLHQIGQCFLFLSVPSRGRAVNELSQKFTVSEEDPQQEPFRVFSRLLVSSRVFSRLLASSRVFSCLLGASQGFSRLLEATRGYSRLLVIGIVLRHPRDGTNWAHFLSTSSTWMIKQFDEIFPHFCY